MASAPARGYNLPAAAGGGAGMAVLAVEGGDSGPGLRGAVRRLLRDTLP